MTNIPYIDLHCHLDGSITVDIARKLAALQNIELPASDAELESRLSVPESCENLNEFLECFALPCSLMQTKEGITESVHLVQEYMKSQGLAYLELRFAPQKHCDNGLSQRDAIDFCHAACQVLSGTASKNENFVRTLVVHYNVDLLYFILF